VGGKGAVVVGLRDKLQQMLSTDQGRPPPQAPPPTGQPHPFDWIVTDEFPRNRMLAIKGTFAAGGHRVMHLGATNTHWMVTSLNGHALALAPPQSYAGKTSSFIIPLILSTFDRVVVTSTKPDIVRATALARAEYGTVWCYAPDGQTPIPPGVHELRWSPIGGAADWSVALRTANDMTKSLETKSMTGGDHWRDRARDTLAPVFHWAALRGYPLRQARDAVFELVTPNDDPVHPGRRVMLGELIVRDLQKDRRADSGAAAVLTSVMSTSDRELASIISEASRALQVYQLPGAIASTEQPNFDPAAFVAGRYGRSTVYIMSSTESQELVAPLVIAFLNQIRQQQYFQQRQYVQEQMARRRAEVDPDGGFPLDAFKKDTQDQVAATSTTVMALDEMYGIAPIPDLPNMLSEGGSQGVLVAGAVQDLALIKDRWKMAGDSFLTLFQDVLIFPGVRHGDTLEMVSKLIGDYDREMPTTSTQRGAGGTSYTEGVSFQRQRRVPPDDVSRGPDPTNQDVLFHLSSQGVGQLWATPYWRSPPWAQVLTSCIELALSGKGESTWAEGARLMGRTDVVEPPLTDLPIPDLTPWAERQRGTDPWADRYLVAKRRWETRLFAARPVRDVPPGASLGVGHARTKPVNDGCERAHVNARRHVGNLSHKPTVAMVHAHDHSRAIWPLASDVVDDRSVPFATHGGWGLGQPPGPYWRASPPRPAVPTRTGWGEHQQCPTPGPPTTSCNAECLIARQVPRNQRITWHDERDQEERPECRTEQPGGRRSTCTPDHIEDDQGRADHSGNAPGDPERGPSLHARMMPRSLGRATGGYRGGVIDHARCCGFDPLPNTAKTMAPPTTETTSRKPKTNAIGLPYPMVTSVGKPNRIETTVK
jgi:type IV secretion system protein VirD4